MIKVVTMIARRADLPGDEFARSLTDCADGLRDSPDVRRHVISVLDSESKRTDIPPLPLAVDIDAVSALWFDSREVYERALRDPRFRSAVARLSAATGHARSFLAVEHTVVPVPSPRPALKGISFFVRRPEWEASRFQQHWLHDHAAMVHGVPFVRGFVLSPVVEQPTSLDTVLGIDLIEVPRLDGIAELWVDSMEARTRMRETPEAKRWFEDGSATIGQITTLMTREVVVRPE